MTLRMMTTGRKLRSAWLLVGSTCKTVYLQRVKLALREAMSNLA